MHNDQFYKPFYVGVMYCNPSYKYCTIPIAQKNKNENIVFIEGPNMNNNNNTCWTLRIIRLHNHACIYSSSLAIGLLRVQELVLLVTFYEDDIWLFSLCILCIISRNPRRTDNNRLDSGLEVSFELIYSISNNHFII